MLLWLLETEDDLGLILLGYRLHMFRCKSLGGQVHINCLQQGLACPLFTLRSYALKGTIEHEHKHYSEMCELAAV